MKIRRERPGDQAAIGAIHGGAFRRSDEPEELPIEVALVERLRASDAWLEALSLVAVVHDRLVGHVVCSRARVESVPVLGLGPIGVIPSMQNRGIGSGLMHQVITESDVMGEALIGLVGSPDYYARFGFVPASALRITAPNPEWGDHFQIRALSSYRSAIAGRFRYAQPFEEV